MGFDCISSWLEVIKLFSCSTQLRMKFFMLINVKMPTIVGILTFVSWKNNILGLSEPKKKAEFLNIFIFMNRGTMGQFRATEGTYEKSFIISGPDLSFYSS